MLTGRSPPPPDAADRGETAHGEVVVDFQTDGVEHVDVLRLDVRTNLRGQGTHVRGHHDDPAGADRVQGPHQGPGAAQHGRRVSVLRSRLGDDPLGFPVCAESSCHYGRQAGVGDDIDVRVGQGHGALGGLADHRREFFLVDGPHSGPGRVERVGVARGGGLAPEELGEFGLHGGVRTRHDQPHSGGRARRRVGPVSVDGLDFVHGFHLLWFRRPVTVARITM
jgi:hypothetical protein